jgi:hypothetical protein
MDLRAGVGAHMWPDGAKYEGEWAYGVQHGRGRYIWADGAHARRHRGSLHARARVRLRVRRGAAWAPRPAAALALGRHACMPCARAQKPLA